MKLSDNELKLHLAKLLPEKIEVQEQSGGITPRFVFWWRDGKIEPLRFLNSKALSRRKVEVV